MSVLVIDNGSGFCKAGFAGDPSPKVEFPSVVGRPRYIPVVAGLEYRRMYVGGAAEARRGVLSLSYPIRNGIVREWDDLEAIWTHAFEQLPEANPEDSAIIVSDPPKNPLKNRERMVELLFEEFGVRGCFVGVQAVLALYAGGNTSGIVLDSGEGLTHVVPVYEGYTIRTAVRRIQIAGRQLTDLLSDLLTERGCYFASTAEFEILRDVKESLCFVSRDFKGDLRSFVKNQQNFEREYELPDGQVISLGSERFRCPEALFQPDLLDIDHPGVQGLVYDSAMRCDIDLRRDLLSNVLLSGGSTLFPGFAPRLRDELNHLCPCEVRVRAPKERRYAVWMGGSVLGSLSTFRNIAITKKEYEEHGPKIVHRKCF